MFTRTTGLLIVPLWLAAMGWLVAHDVWPAWTAQEPPRVRATQWLAGEGKRAQYAIHGGSGRIGTIWTEYLVDANSVQRFDLVWIDQLPIEVVALRVTADSTYTADGLLDELTVRLQNNDVGMRLHGERFHADFSFTFEAGPVEKAFKVPLADGGLIAEAFSPYGQLPDLRVGQTWRMQVFNPIAAVTGVGDRFTSILVEVTGQESISTPDGERSCFVVESLTTKAWVDRHGEVIEQEVTLPVIGKIRIVREPEFDEDARTAKRRRSLSGPMRRRR